MRNAFYYMWSGVVNFMPYKCYLCEDRTVDCTYRQVLICAECDALSRSQFIFPILRQRLRMEPTLDMVMTISRFAGPCLEMRRRLHHLRAVLLSYNSYFHVFCDHSGGPGLISCNEEILDRILSFLGGIGDIISVYGDRNRNHPRTRDLYVQRLDNDGRLR